MSTHLVCYQLWEKFFMPMKPYCFTFPGRYSWRITIIWSKKYAYDKITTVVKVPPTDRTPKHTAINQCFQEEFYYSLFCKSLERIDYLLFRWRDSIVFFPFTLNRICDRHMWDGLKEFQSITPKRLARWTPVQIDSDIYEWFPDHMLKLQ